MRSTNLRLQSAPLSPSFSGTPSDLLREIVRLTRIVSPDGYYGIVVSDIEPESNQGLWLKEGTKIYVWSDDEARYVPADITDGIATQLAQLADLVSRSAAGRIIFSPVEPGASERLRTLWFRTSGDAVIASRVWDPAAHAWRQPPGTVYHTATTTGTTDDQYVLSLDSPADLAQFTGVLIAVKWHRTSTGPVTLRIAGVIAEADLVDSATGVQIGSGGVRESQVSVVVYDGIEFQLVTLQAAAAVHGSLLVTAPGAGTFVVPDYVFSLKVTACGGGGGGGFNNTAKGGGGGGIAVKHAAVTPGDVIEYFVGAGGARESAFGANDAGTGQDSTSFDGTLIGRGGRGGSVAGGGIGGSYLGGDYGIDGAPGSLVFDDKCLGGIAAFPGSVGGMRLVAGRFGGGGGGDLDSEGNDTSDGGTGAVLFEW